MFRLVVAPLVKFEVRGSLTDAEGKAAPFDFALVAKRERAESLEQTLQTDTDTSIRAYLTERVTDWAGVADADGRPMPFTAEGLAALFALPGMPQVCFRAYLAAVTVQAKAKN